MTKTVTIAAAVGVAVAIGVGAYFLQKDEPTVSPYYANADDAELVALGETIYQDNCASCHGVNREGEPNWRQPLPEGGLPAPPHDETGHTWHHPDQMLFAVTKFGGQFNAPKDFQSNMPPFEESLTDREILAVLAYIKSMWPQEIQARQDSMTRKMAEQMRG